MLALITLASFNGTNGYDPSSLVLDGQGNLYGTTVLGGTAGYGSVFEIANGSNTITTLASFNGTNGQDPYKMVLDNQGNLYGIAAAGGANSDGTVFEIAKGSNTITTLASFNGTNGYDPSSLVLDGQGNLYGTTLDGGANSDGTVFEIAKGSNTITTLASLVPLSGHQGDLPYSLVLDSQGNLYGTTEHGGAAGDGTVFEIAKGSNTITTLVSFNGTNGNEAEGLVLDGQGNLYGETFLGGAANDGTVFEIAKGSNTITTLASFNGTNGQHPFGGLALDSQGNLYGTTESGGAANDGTLFEIAKGSNTITTLASFNGTNGSEPIGGVVLDGQGNLYGTTYSGGAAGDGTVFELSGVTAITPSSVFVNAAWAGDASGTAVTWTDGSTHYVGYDAFGTIQSGINAVASGGTVNVASGTYNETDTFAQNVTITGAGATTVTVNGQSAGSVFTVDNGVTATLSGLTITGGSATNGGGIDSSGILTITTCTIESNSASSSGGGIWSGGQTLTINNSTINNNTAGVSGGIYIQSGTATVVGCTIDNNSATGQYGVGIQNSGALSITNSTISGNSALIGGGIDNGGNLSVSYCTVSDNSAIDSDPFGYGGGIYNYAYGSATIMASTISGNTAASSGGGICEGSINDGSPLTITDSTISGNSAASGGGGIADFYIVTIRDSTIALNSVGTVSSGGGLNGGATLDNTIVALNTSGTGKSPDDIRNNVSATSSYNLIGTGGSGGLTNETNGNQVGVANPGLDPNGLQNNGGPTQTIALVSGSPAINAGSNALAVDASGNTLQYDQRGPGYPRIESGTVDIGAFEFHPSLTLTPIAPVSPNPRNTPVSSIDVTFSEPINSSTFTTSALTLSDNGGANLITSAVTISLVSGSTYRIGGLSVLTTAEGQYTLTVSAAGVQDQDGNVGTGSRSTSWLMDTTPPTSSVSALPSYTASTSFLVSVTGTDPSGANGSTPSGIASFAIYDSVNGGPFTLFTTVTPAHPSATFTGQVGNSYGFYSVATDNGGNVQATPTAAQASTTIVTATNLTAISGSGTYGLTATLTATLTANGSGVANEPVTFSFINGTVVTTVGTATTNASGVATQTGVSHAGNGAGT